MRIGLVGCGGIGKVHAAAINHVAQADLCAFADIHIDRAENYSKTFTGGKAESYASLEEMFVNEELDVIHICTPHACHVPMAIAALERNINVFAEKPPAIGRDEFFRLEQAEANSAGRVGICFQNRYNGSTKKVDELLAGGTLGAVKGGRAFVTWNRNAPYYTESGWRGSLKTEGGGVLINQAIHTLDLLLRWIGTPIKSEACIQNHHLNKYIEVEDTMEAYLTFSEGEDPVRALFYATNAYVCDAPVFIEIACKNGSIRLESNRVWYQVQQEEPVCWKEEPVNALGKSYWGTGHEACIHDYYNCLLQQTPYANDLHSVRNIFHTVMDLYDSAREK